MRYREIVALQSADLQVPAGSICGLVGVNGSGKSTLLKAIVGSVTPSQGAVEVFGTSSRDARERTWIGYVPQSEAIDWNFPLCVSDVVMTGRYGHMGWRRKPTTADQVAVKEALERVELSQFADRQVGQLSGGQRKRVFIARGLAQRSRLLLLDEPFAGIDRPSQDTITRVLRESAASGTAIVVATHDLAGLPTLCDSVALMKRTVLMHASPAIVLEPANLVRAFGLDPTSSGDVQ